MLNFNETIAEWVHVDNQIKELNMKISELKEEKNNVSDKLNEYVENYEVDKKSINVNLKDSQIKFVTTKVPQTLTFKYLEKCLDEIITDKEQVTQIIEYVKSNREINEVNEIKRIYKK
jgi:chaperonin cofactor prefoldin